MTIPGIIVKRVETYSLREGSEAWEDGGSEMEIVRQGGREGRRLVTGVRSGWGRFALNEDEVSDLPAVRRRVWTCP